MFKDIIISIQAYAKAHQLIRKHKLWKWIIIPGLLYCILFVFAAFQFVAFAENLIGWIIVKSGLSVWIAKTHSGLLGFIFTFWNIVFLIILFIYCFSLFKYFFLIVGSPIFAYLSEKTESIITGHDFPFSFKQLLKDMARGIMLALRNTLWQTVYMVSILLFSCLPVLGWMTPLLAILIECYYYGFSMLDYSMERHKKTSSQSIHFIGTHKGLAIGNGLVFYLLHLLPFVGWVLAPSYAVIAATLSLTNPTSSQLKK